MYDLAVPNETPGPCAKCQGTGEYRWGATVNGRSQHTGPCFSCQGTGQQTRRDMRRNRSYNRHKIRLIASL